MVGRRAMAGSGGNTVWDSQEARKALLHGQLRQKLSNNQPLSLDPPKARDHTRMCCNGSHSRASFRGRQQAAEEPAIAGSCHILYARLEVWSIWLVKKYA